MTTYYSGSVLKHLPDGTLAISSYVDEEAGESIVEQNAGLSGRDVDARAEQLVTDLTKAQLQHLAERAGVDTSGPKTEIAQRLAAEGVTTPDQPLELTENAPTPATKPEEYQQLTRAQRRAAEGGSETA